MSSLSINEPVVHAPEPIPAVEKASSLEEEKEESAIKMEEDEEESSLAEKPEMTAEEKEKAAYIEQIATQEQSCQANLIQMYDIGLRNFTVNVNTLKRAKGNLLEAINMIMNGEVGQSIFE